MAKAACGDRGFFPRYGMNSRFNRMLTREDSVLSVASVIIITILRRFSWTSLAFFSIQFKRYLLSLEIQYENKTILYR